MSGDETASPERTFWVGGVSQRGPVHVKRGLPNQDAIFWQQPEVHRLPIVLAVSDGHGSAAYFRSDIGSGLAVHAAVEEGMSLIEDEARDEQPIATVKRLAEERLAQRIVQRWTAMVSEHVQAHPITDEERERLAATSGAARCLERLDRNVTTAYGATLLAIIVTARFAVFIQLGDGDLLWVDASGESQFLFPAPADEVGEETASLCMKEAWRYVQVKVVPLPEGPPPLLLASTDGYKKSFVNDEGFLRIGRDYRELIRNSGIAALDRSLPDFLVESTGAGSGDDITLGFIRGSEADDFDSILSRRIETEVEQQTQNKADRRELGALAEDLSSVKGRFEEEFSSVFSRLDRVERLVLACCGTLILFAVGLAVLASRHVR